MLVTSAEMKAIEERAFARGASAETLMEEAGAKIAEAIAQFFPDAGHCRAVFGKGHNGGDALVASRHLANSGWRVETEAVFQESEWAPLTRQKFAELGRAGDRDRPARGGVRIVLDGVLGIGATGPLRGAVAHATERINQLRESGAYVFAIDVPTGLHADRGEISSQTVVADFTTTIGFAKTGLVADAATAHVGRLSVLPLAALTEAASADDNPSREDVATADVLSTTLRRRRFDMHKGMCGRVAIVAGSDGMTGAAAMCAKACMRAGAGLVSLITTEEIQPILAVTTTPEVMVRAVKSYREILDLDFDAVAIGPGLGDRYQDDVLAIIAQSRVPTVIDADALNIVARAIKILDGCAGPRLLTPHPGEMARLDSGSAQRARRETAEAFTARWPHALLLKGARTLVAQRGVGISYNTTGNPGMASGGMGDVLTGVCAALAGQKLSLFDAARLGAWLCGRAAEIAVFRGGQSEESLCASDVIDHLGRAFRDVHASVW